MDNGTRNVSGVLVYASKLTIPVNLFVFWYQIAMLKSEKFLWLKIKSNDENAL